MEATAINSVEQQRYKQYLETTAKMHHQNTLSFSPAKERTPTNFTSVESPNHQEQLQREQQLARIEQANALKEQAEIQETNQKKELQQTSQKEAQKAARAAIQRGLETGVNFLCSCITVGTAGVGFLIAGIPYMVTLASLNLQMIWGYYITKGKSWLFPPLEWNPLPIPLPNKVLHAGLVTIDFLVFMLLFVGCLMLIILVFGQQIIAGGTLYVVYGYFTDPLMEDFVNSFFGL